jgi:DtxR family Mn-dependent transcriptional regulator
MALVADNQLSASMEDYLEAIYNLTGQANVARSRDIAELLDVSKASVTGALRSLKSKGLANYKPYDYITLTEAGEDVAREIVKKHNILKSFFVDVLGIKKEIAQNAACKAEHALGPEVIARLLHFSDFVTQKAEDGFDLTEKFDQFCEKQMEKS